jgi:hypothetical protein
MGRESSPYSIAWANGLFTITWASTYSPVSFSSSDYTTVNHTANNYFDIGVTPGLTTLDWTACTSPAAAATKADLLAAIAALVTGSYTFTGDLIVNGSVSAHRFIMTEVSDELYLGYGAGGSNIGTENLGIGAFALASAVGVNFCTAIGTRALFSAVSTNTVTAIGSFAGEAQVDGYNAVYVGYGAGQQMVHETDNIGIGVFACYGDLGGAGIVSSVGIGTEALKFATGAGRHVAVGWDSGKTANTGADNTLLGYNTQAPGAVSNVVVLGSGSSCSASNSTVLSKGIASSTANEVVVSNSTQTIIRPDGDNVTDLGSASKRLKNIYAGTGVVFNSGTISDYVPTNPSALTFTGAFTTGQTVTLQTSILGKRVTLTFPSKFAAASVADHITSTALPAAYRPSQRVAGYTPVQTNSTFAQGTYSIETSGVIQIGNGGNNPSLPGSFAAAGNAGWEGFSISYNLS